MVLPTPIESGALTNCSYGADTLLRHPAAAVQIATTISRFSDIDLLFEQILTKLLAAEGAAVGILLRSIPSHHSRIKVIKELIKGHVNKENGELFRAAMKAVDPVRTIRNKFAHGIWGYSSDHPESLILAESGALNTSYSAAAQISEFTYFEEIKNLLTNTLTGETGSQLSDVDRNQAIELILKVQQNPKTQRAFDLLFGGQNKLISACEVWSLEQILKASIAASAAQHTIVGCQICFDFSRDNTYQIRSHILQNGLLLVDPKTLLT